MTYFAFLCGATGREQDEGRLQDATKKLNKHEEATISSTWPLSLLLRVFTVCRSGVRQRSFKNILTSRLHRLRQSQVCRDGRVGGLSMAGQPGKAAASPVSPVAGIMSARVSASGTMTRTCPRVTRRPDASALPCPYPP